MKHVLIIGAGPAGLTAAYELLKKGGVKVTVVEATNEIGGISRTVQYKGNRMDIGGHRFFSKDEEIMDWWKNILSVQGNLTKDDIIRGRYSHIEKGGPDPEKEDEVMLKRARISRIFYRHHFFDYPISLKWDTIKNLGFITCIQSGISYLYSCLMPKEENSLENFYVNRFGRKLYHIFFEGYTQKVWGRHPSRMNADWGAQRVKGLSIRAVLKDAFFNAIGKTQKEKETSLIEEFLYPKYGPGQLWETVAKRVIDMGGELYMETEANRIYETDDGIYHIKVTGADGMEKTFTADYVVSSMPMRNLAKAIPVMPEEVKKVAEGLQYRDFVTMGLLVDKLALKNETDIKIMQDQVPDNWIYVQDQDVKVGRIQIFNNWSPYMVRDPEHSVWIGLEYFCMEGDEIWEMPEHQFLALVKKELEKMGVINTDTQILDYHKEKAEKAYPCYFGTYARLEVLKKYLDQYQGLICVGRNGQHRYNNMDHSMKTGILAAEYILEGTRNQELRKEIWNVNTEENYHEKK